MSTFCWPICFIAWLSWNSITFGLQQNFCWFAIWIFFKNMKPNRRCMALVKSFPLPTYAFFFPNIINIVVIMAVLDQILLIEYLVPESCQQNIPLKSIKIEQEWTDIFFCNTLPVFCNLALDECVSQMCCVYINKLQCIFLPLICWKTPWNHVNFYQLQHHEISQLNHSLWRNIFLFLTWHLLNFIFTVYKNWEVDSKKIFLYLLFPLVILELAITLCATSDQPVISTFLVVILTDWLILILMEWILCNRYVPFCCFWSFLNATKAFLSLEIRSCIQHAKCMDLHSGSMICTLSACDFLFVLVLSTELIFLRDTYYNFKILFFGGNL